MIVLLPCNFRPPFEFVTNKRWASPRSPRHTLSPVIPTIQSIDFFGGIPERSMLDRRGKDQHRIHTSNPGFSKNRPDVISLLGNLTEEEGTSSRKRSPR